MNRHLLCARQWLDARGTESFSDWEFVKSLFIGMENFLGLNEKHPLAGVFPPWFLFLSHTQQGQGKSSKLRAPGPTLCGPSGDNSLAERPWAESREERKSLCIQAGG